MTVSSAIPAAVISMAGLRLFATHSILENNIVQTTASAGSSIAAGVVFTVPALYLMGFWQHFDFWWVLVIAGLGGVLGVLFSVPLRRALIIERKLPFPEGLATAEVLKAGGSGSGVKYLVGAALAGGTAKLGEIGLLLWSGTAELARYAGNTVLYFGTNVTEVLSRITDWKDHNTCILLGDGAGAMVVRPTDDPNRGLLSTHLHSDGSLVDILKAPGGGSRIPISHEMIDQRLQYLKMNGREVYKVAVRALEEVSREALAASGLQTTDVDYVIAHQANKRILDSTLQRLGIPVLEVLDEPREVWQHLIGEPAHHPRRGQSRRLVQAGRPLLMMAIGGGMAWGSAVLRW